MKRDFHAPGRSPVYGTSGMAATSMPVATLTALDILKAGGNTLGAAIAASAVLAVVEPQSTGVGGDCFCLYAPAGTGQVVALNGSGKAPAALTAAAMRAQGLATVPQDSAHSVTVPGAISAWSLLSEKLGRLGLDTLLHPRSAWPRVGGRCTPGSPWTGQRRRRGWRRARQPAPSSSSTASRAYLATCSFRRSWGRPCGRWRPGCGRLLRGADRRRHGRHAATGGRGSYRGGTSQPAGVVPSRAADLGQMARHGGVPVPAERLRSARTHAARHPRWLRDAEGGTALGQAAARHIEAARLAYRTETPSSRIRRRSRCLSHG